MKHKILRLLGLTLLAVALSLVSIPAVQAHPDIDAGRKLAKQLEFEPALIAFQRALDSGTLTYEELLTLLSERVLLLHGLKRNLERDSDLQWLSAIAPEYDFDMRAPPELDVAFRELRSQRKGPLAIKLTYELSGSLEAHAKLINAPPLGARIRIHVREAGGAWRSEQSDTLWQVAIPGQRLELYAEALALGGVVVAHDHSKEEPLRVTVPAEGQGTQLGVAAVPAPLSATPVDDDERSKKRKRRWLIATGVVVVAAAAVGGYLLYRDHKDDNDPKDQKTTVSPTVQF